MTGDILARHLSAAKSVKHVVAFKSPPLENKYPSYFISLRSEKGIVCEEGRTAENTPMNTMFTANIQATTEQDPPLGAGPTIIYKMILECISLDDHEILSR